MKYTETTCNIAPGCFYKAVIRIYSSVKAMRAAFDGELFNDDELQAFCSCNNGEDPLVTLHFALETLTPAIAAHEVFHAVAELIRACKLNLEDNYTQELCAHSVSHLMEEIEKVVQLSKRR